MKICYRYAGSYQEAVELTAESFVKLFKTIQQFNRGRQPFTEILFKTWFKKIIINTCIEGLRRNYTTGNNYLTAKTSRAAVVAVENINAKSSQEEIIEAIKQLILLYRTVYNLYVIEGIHH